MLRSATPDLVFLDVRMPDMTGCDVLDAVNVPLPAVIFVTAHHQYAIEAFDRDAVDYLLKPFDETRFRAAVARARREMLSRLGRNVEAEPRLGDRRFLSRLAVPAHGRVVFMKTSEIDVIEAAGNYVSIRAGSESHLARIGLTALEARLDPDRFVRIHRSAIVNLDFVREVLPWSGGEQVLVMSDGRQMNIGRRYRSAITEAMSRPKGR